MCPQSFFTVTRERAVRAIFHDMKYGMNRMFADDCKEGLWAHFLFLTHFVHAHRPPT